MILSSLDAMPLIVLGQMMVKGYRAAICGADISGRYDRESGEFRPERVKRKDEADGATEKRRRKGERYAADFDGRVIVLTADVTAGCH